jgi:ankyrin repeat protein
MAGNVEEIVTRLLMFSKREFGDPSLVAFVKILVEWGRPNYRLAESYPIHINSPNEMSESMRAIHDSIREVPPLARKAFWLSLLRHVNQVEANFIGRIFKRNRQYDLLDMVHTKMSPAGIEAINTPSDRNAPPVIGTLLGDWFEQNCHQQNALVNLQRFRRVMETVPEMTNALQVYFEKRCTGEPLLRLLLDYDADANAVLWNRETPLILSLRQKNLRCVKLLLERGAWVRTSFHGEQETMLLRLPVLIGVAQLQDAVIVEVFTRLLLKYGADVTATTDMWVPSESIPNTFSRVPTFSNVLVANRHPRLVDILIDAGAQLDVITLTASILLYDDTGKFLVAKAMERKLIPVNKVIEIVVQHGSPDSLDVLFDHGLRIDFMTLVRYSPASRCLEKAHVLLTRRISPNRLDLGYNRPLDRALAANDYYMIDCLLAVGARPYRFHQNDVYRVLRFRTAQ